MKILQKIWHFIVWHPIWAMLISWFAFYIINSMSGGNQTPASTLILTLFAYLFLSIFIRKTRDKAYAEEKAKEPFIVNALKKEDHLYNEYTSLEDERKWYAENIIKQKEISENDEPVYNDEIDYANSYEAKYLLTKNEWYQYHTLKKIADEKGYVICPKVRLMDIIQPRKGVPKYKTLFYKIQAKHIDFLICDSDLRIKAIIELDDNSHNEPDRKERDEFVDMILQSVGYKVIHTKYIANDILDNI